MKCTACGKELTKKEILYTEDKIPYHANPFECGHALHPNSVENIVARGGAVKLYTEDELEKTAYQRLDVSDEIKSQIEKIISKPQSIRLMSVDLAYYLIQLQIHRGLPNLAEAVRYCIRQTLETHPIDAIEENLELPEDPEQESELESKPVIKFTVPDEPAKVEIEDEEESMTF